MDPECQPLGKRLIKHAEELFTFVACPGVEATNNVAERALRPYVVKRKISGAVVPGLGRGGTRF